MLRKPQFKDKEQNEKANQQAQSINKKQKTSRLTNEKRENQRPVENPESTIKITNIRDQSSHHKEKPKKARFDLEASIAKNNKGNKKRRKNWASNESLLQRSLIGHFNRSKKGRRMQITNQMQLPQKFSSESSRRKLIDNRMSENPSH